MKKQELMKYRLADAMKQCMKDTPVERITVKEIADTCGTTRQTFYRNFQDKYDLINWYFDKILLESFEHMGEGRTIYEGLVKKFEFIDKEKVFFRAAFKSDEQNCLKDHDFCLILQFYTEKIESKSGKQADGKLTFPPGNVLPGVDLYDGAVGVRQDGADAPGTGAFPGGSDAGGACRSLPGIKTYQLGDTFAIL